MAKETKKAVEETEKRKVTRRTAEERLAILDSKIKSHKEAIEKLEAKKEAILHPKVRTSKAAQMKLLLNKAKESGMSNEEIAEKLGIKLD